MDKKNYLHAFEQQEMRRLQLILALAAVVQPIWYLITSRAYPEQYDFLWPRLLIAVTVLVYILFLDRLPRDKWHRDLVLIPIGIVFTLHGFFLTWLNHWSAHHVLEIAITICISYTLIHTKKGALLFTALVAVSAFYFSFFFVDGKNGGLNFFWLAMVIGAGLLASYGRLNMINKLISAEANANLILQYMADGILVCNEKLEAIYANNALVRLFQVPLDQIYGLTPESSGLKVVQEDGETPVNDWPLVEAQRTKAIVNPIALKLIRPDSSVIQVIVTAVPVIDEETGEVTRTFMTLQDVTNFRAIEEMVRHQQTLIANSAKLRALGEMAGNIAHEINTPLATISVSAEFIEAKLKEKKGNSPQIQTALERIRLTVDRISKIIRGMRELVHSDDQDPMEVVQIQDVVDLIRDLCQERLLRDSITFYVDCPEDFEIRCRPRQIAQLLLNLVNNAFDVLPPGKRSERWIKLVIRRSITQAEIAVLDSGPGIPEKLHDKLWQPFYTTKENGKGLGLGLSISRRIAEDHNGTLTYEPEDHTRFILRLPLKITGASPTKKSA